MGVEAVWSWGVFGIQRPLLGSEDWTECTVEMEGNGDVVGMGRRDPRRPGFRSYQHRSRNSLTCCKFSTSQTSSQLNVTMKISSQGKYRLILNGLSLVISPGSHPFTRIVKS